MHTDLTDEMLARYLCGQANADEAQAVLDHLAEDDARLDDLLAMTASVELFRQEAMQTKPRVRPLWAALSAAASVALLVGVGLALWLGHPSGRPVALDPAPAYAQQDSLAPTAAGTAHTGEEAAL